MILEHNIFSIIDEIKLFFEKRLQILMECGPVLHWVPFSHEFTIDGEECLLALRSSTSQHRNGTDSLEALQTK